jgi:Uncharacterized conserved protein
MCGRYQFSCEGSDGKLNAIHNVMEKHYAGGYKTGEIFPGDTVPAIIERQNKIVAVPAVFGFSGFEDKKLLINARSETAAAKKTFSDCLRNRRIVLPAQGFYEWSQDDKRTKYLFTADTVPTIYLCGIYRIEEGKLRFVILTRKANETMSDIHPRMPVIISENDVRAYLTDFDAASALLASPAPELSKKAMGKPEQPID